MDAGYTVHLGTWNITPKPKDDLPALLEIPNAPTLAQIQELQGVLASGVAGPVLDLSEGLSHYFAPEMYGRMLAIPANRGVVGKIHRHAHLVLLMTGEATIWTDQGKERICGPKAWVSPVGVKRVLVTHTDCVFFTVHATNETDLELLEAELITPEAQMEYAPEFPSLELQGMYA